MRLYEIPDALRAVEAEIIDADGEMTPEVEAKLDALEGEFAGKAEYIALLAREAAAEATGVESEVKRLTARMNAARNRERRLKDYLHMCMTRIGLDKIEGERAKVRVQANGRPSIKWLGEPEDAPEPFRRVVVSVDGTAAYKAWKEDGELPDGFQVERGSHVRIY